MLHVAKYIWSFVVEALPEITNVILVLAGIFISQRWLAEKIKNQKTAMRFRIGCVLLGLVGLVTSVNQRLQSEAQMITLLANVNTSVVNSNILVSNTNSLVSNMNIVLLVVPQVAALNSKLADLDAKSDAAKGNPRLLADLQEQARKTREQADVASTQLLLTMASEIADQLERSAAVWHGQDEGLYLQSISTGDPETKQKLFQEKTDLSRSYSFLVAPLMRTGENLREQLFQKFPSLEQTDSDRTVASIFARAIAGEPIKDYQDLRATGLQLEDIVRRISKLPGK